MSLNHYKLYLEQVFQLAETIVIKSEDSALSINKRLAFLHGEDVIHPTDKTTWKYYLNLAGKYHPLDKKIIITSLDTLAPIEFNADTLRIHTATARAYQYGTRYYRELISQNQRSEPFILGALNPVDLTVSIESQDFTILSYPSKYVEYNEESLIPNINQWLLSYKERWYNRQYNMSDNLYLTGLLGVLYQQLVPLILTLRLRKCKTSEAHSYHVREFLASNGMLDEYLDYMTHKQALFFYRNINYIERNPGKVETFDWLLQKVLTDRDIPVSEISLAQDDSELLTSYRPVTRFARQPINYSTSVDSSTSAFYTLTELLAKEEKQAPGNSQYIKQSYQIIEDKLSKSKTNSLKTKVLESKMVDYTDSGLYSIQDTALDLWCHMSITGQYSAVINFTNTVTNKNIAIPNHVAFLYFIYAYCQVHSIEVLTVPELVVNRVAIHPLPTLEDLQKVVDKNYVTQSDLLYLLSLHTPLEQVISTSGFNDFVKKTYVSYKAEHMFAVNQNDLYKRALIKNASYRLYKAQRQASPFLGQEFATIFKDHGLPCVGLNKAEWNDIYKDVYEKATGVNISQTDTKAAIQETMIKLFKKLSSYSIQFLSEINKTTIRSINWSAVRMGDLSRYGEDLRHIQLPIIRIFSLLSHSKDYRWIELKNLLLDFYVWTKVDLKFIDITIDAWQQRPRVRYNININTVHPNVDSLQVCALPSPEGVAEFSKYFNLTQEDKRKVRDIYQNRVSDEDFIPKVDIESIDHISKIVATNYLYQPTNHLVGFKHAIVPKSFELRTDRDFTELDAFGAHFGELNAEAFKPFIGGKKNDLGFKLMPGPLESQVKSFKYSGGIRYNPGFDFSLNPGDDVDIQGFVFLMGPPLELGIFNPVYDKQILNFFFNTQYSGHQLGTYEFKSYKTIIDDMRLIVDTRVIDVGQLVAGSEHLFFKLNNQSKARIKLTFEFLPRIDVVLDPTEIEVGTYQIGSYSISTGSGEFDYTLSGGAQYLGSYKYLKDTQEITVSGFVSMVQNIASFKLNTATQNLSYLDTIYGTVEAGKYKWPVEGGFDWKTLTQDVKSFKINSPPIGEATFTVLNEPVVKIGAIVMGGFAVKLSSYAFNLGTTTLTTDTVINSMAGVDLGTASYNAATKVFVFI